MQRKMILAVTTALMLSTGACDRRAGQDAGGGASATAPATAASTIERGRYLASIMDCAGCHNKGSFSPNPGEGLLQGGTIGFEVPGLGVFYPPNLTSDAQTGLGRWSEADIMNAVTKGQRPDGRMLAPAMPWHAYSALTNEDSRALAAYLKSLPAVTNQVPAPGPKEQAPRPYMTVVPPPKA